MIRRYRLVAYISALKNDPELAQTLYDKEPDRNTQDLMYLAGLLDRYLNGNGGEDALQPARISPKPSPLVARCR